MSAMLLASLLTGCAAKTKTCSENALFKSQNVQAATLEHGESDEELRRAYSEFVFGVMRDCAKNAGTQNVVISPDSLMFALEMAAAGADGKTLDQMTQTMVPGASDEDGLLFGADHYNELQNESLTIANSMWINKDSKVYGDYIEYVKENFDADITYTIFDDDAVKAINSWVNDKTDGMIPSIIQDLDQDERLMLINAITFNGTWAQEYIPQMITDGTFLNGQGTEESCTYLNSYERWFVCNDNCTGFLKDYSDGKYAFMAILPDDENIDINEFMAQMTADDYWTLWDNMEKRTLAVKLPEFKSEYEKSLIDTLMQMGMTDAFGPNADFSNISVEDIYISSVFQKAYIEVNRDGTKAAAVSAVGATQSASVCEITYIELTRPFAYAIVDKDTGLPVFLGTVESVK